MTVKQQKCVFDNRTLRAHTRLIGPAIAQACVAS